ncbi:MAG: SH3 domain-containing protein [Thermomicrobiales bacterium]
MTDSGLSTRLRQQSRRAGLMVGITMALTIIILILGAAGLFAWLSRPFSDLIPVAAPAVSVPAPSATQPPAEQPQPQSEQQVAAAEPQPTEPPPTAATTAAPSTTAFKPTHQIGASQSVNFRAGPSTSDAIIIALSPATPLQYLNEDEPTTNPSDGDRWMKFRNEAGQEGWVREIDTVPYQP